MRKRLWSACLVVCLLLAGCSGLATPVPTATAIPTEPPTAAPAPTDTPAPQASATPGPTTAPTDTPLPAATDTPAQSPTPETAFMTFQDFSIVPGTLTIRAGSTVVFQIKAGFGSFHQPYSSFPNNTNISGLFEAPPLLGDGASYSFTFTAPGSYTVRCGYHPNEMVATIEVTP